MSVQLYNFQKPGPLASAVEQRFTAWLGNLSALATNAWRKQLPGGFEIKAVVSGADRAGDILGALSEDSIVYRLNFSERLPTLIVWPRRLVLCVAATLLGDEIAELPEDRELTVVEESLFEFFLKTKWIPFLKESWHAPLQPEISAREPNPRFCRLYGRDESLIITRFTLRGPFGEESWDWLIPMKGLLETLQDGAAQREETAAVAQRVQRAVRDLPVPVAITLGVTRVPLTQLASLKPGDVLILDQRINQPLAVKVGEVHKMRAWPGRVGKRQAFQIEEVCK